MSVDLSEIPDAFEIRIGLPRPNWATIDDWVAANTPEQNRDAIWTSIVKQWLQRIRSGLSANYTISESDNFVLLSPGSSPPPDQMLFWCESYRASILQYLPAVAQDNCFGKHVVIAFDKLRTYYDYVADFYPDDGEFGGSGGMYLREGYSHFVFWTKSRWELDRTVLHELTHALLSHLPLPLWLNEGVTQMMEDIVLEASSFAIDHEMVQRHRAYWTNDVIHAFWTGESFHLPDDGQELSYHLAEVLVRNLCSDFPSKILDFLRSANSADAGDIAARKIFGIGLGNRVEQFLGRGDWQPRSDYDQIASGPAA